ncbi:Protein of unknown function [Bacillus mycoides]|uniref:Uncharacterized protein n=1 Tax=Bacillus mycoides TaxID=1405 RepID=A0A1G4EQ54_BACMY|nr:Protein of unknown function [Bacillus mycoides]
MDVVITKIGFLGEYATPEI